MTLVHISIQAFPQDNRKHFLYFQRLFFLSWKQHTVHLPSLSTLNVQWENFNGGPLCLEVVCLTNIPSLHLVLTSTNISLEMKRENR